MKFLLVVIIIAIAVYFAVRLIQDGGFSSSGAKRPGPAPRRPHRPAKPSRPVAPDDDEEFLRDLDRKRLDPPDS
ncbi:hypothetical protein [Nocardioides sp. YIM 152588]|uniref:hypothetical protein n=1 Tax=Nocardioides sp. YIM 152588 TaxID=3158259 RepID=UPI0032E46BDE